MSAEQIQRPSELIIWLKAIRPGTLFAAVAPVVVGLAVAAQTHDVSVGIAAATLLCSILIQIGTNFANDYFDFKSGADNDDRLGPARATAKGWVTPAQMKAAYIGTFVLAFFFGLYLVTVGGWPILLIGVLSILFGVLYTGGPMPLGYVGLGDVFVFVFFGPVAVAGTVFLQTLNWELSAGIAGCVLGALATAILVVNNLRDIDTDRAAGKMTLVARFGFRFGQIEYVLCWATAIGSLFWLAQLFPERALGLFVAMGFTAVLAIVLTVRLWPKKGTELNPLLPQTAIGLLFVSIALSVALSTHWIL